MRKIRYCYASVCITSKAHCGGSVLDVGLRSVMISMSWQTVSPFGTLLD